MSQHLIFRPRGLCLDPPLGRDAGGRGGGLDSKVRGGGGLEGGGCVPSLETHIDCVAILWPPPGPWRET